MSKTHLSLDGDYVMGPGEVSDEPEGFTETGFVMSDVPQELKDAHAANRMLKSEGGPGDGISDVVDGELLTVKETVALAIAKQVIADVMNGEKRGTKLHKVAMVKFTHKLDLRVKGRATTEGAVLAEIGRLHNLSKYGNRVRRR